VNRDVSAREREKLLALIFDEEPTTPRRNLRDVA